MGTEFDGKITHEYEESIDVVREVPELVPVVVQHAFLYGVSSCCFRQLQDKTVSHECIITTEL